MVFFIKEELDEGLASWKHAIVGAVVSFNLPTPMSRNGWISIGRNLI